MKAIIFGINGQDGYYLNLLLSKENIEVIGVSRSKGNWLVGHVAERKIVEELIREFKPEFVFHLAANSTTNHEALFENHETISTGTLNILESAYRHSPKSKIFLSGSGLQFINTGQPISENDPFEARSPYGVARIQSVYAARYYRKLGLQVYVGYFFHHDSPRRSERHLSMKIAQAALRISNGSNETIEIGNMDVIKEYSYAGDIMEAVWLFVNQNKQFESVIGSGKGYSIKEWIEICFSKIGKEWNQHIKINDSFQPEFMSLISNPSLIYSTGWRPIVAIDALADRMMGVKV